MVFTFKLDNVFVKLTLKILINKWFNLIIYSSSFFSYFFIFLFGRPGRYKKFLNKTKKQIFFLFYLYLLKLFLVYYFLLCQVLFIIFSKQTIKKLVPITSQLGKYFFRFIFTITFSIVSSKNKDHS